jgi:hypothetical protein
MSVEDEDIKPATGGNEVGFRSSASPKSSRSATVTSPGNETGFRSSASPPRTRTATATSPSNGFRSSASPPRTRTVTAAATDKLKQPASFARSGSRQSLIRTGSKKSMLGRTGSRQSLLTRGNSKRGLVRGNSFRDSGGSSNNLGMRRSSTLTSPEELKLRTEQRKADAAEMKEMDEQRRKTEKMLKTVEKRMESFTGYGARVNDHVMTVFCSCFLFLAPCAQKSSRSNRTLILVLLFSFLQAHTHTD